MNKMKEDKIALNEQKLNEEFLSNLYESIQYLPESEQEAFLQKMNEAGGGGIKEKILGLFGSPEKSLEKLKKNLTEIVATFDKIIVAIDNAVKLNPGIDAQTVENDKAKISSFKEVFAGILAEANGVDANLDDTAPAGEENAEQAADGEQPADEESDEELANLSDEDKKKKVEELEAIINDESKSEDEKKKAQEKLDKINGKSDKADDAGDAPAEEE